jgi:hypothetical protein
LQRLAATYNRLGGLMSVLARQMGVDVASVLAVWQIESGGRVHVPGSAVIRFENHLFYRLWGRANEDTYNRHFRHGGHAGLPGKSYQNHRFREDPSGEWLPQHGEDGGGQSTEYRVLALARRLAGDGAAIQCISMGGPQILGSNYRGLGYASPRQMYDAFQASEHSHVLGFFDFCRQTAAPSRGALIGYLRDQRWQDFARYYNGPGQVERYGGLLQAAYTQAKRLGI